MGLAKWRMQWLNEQRYFYQTFVQGKSAVLLMPPHRQAPNVSTNAMKRLYYIFITIGLSGSCSSSDTKFTKLDSDEYESRVDRIEILRKEVKYFSDFHDAEFELFNVNGFRNQRTSTPGLSSWDYKFVVKIDTINISKWTNGMKAAKSTDFDDNWTKEITRKRKQNWETISEPQYFIRDGENVTMLVYLKEGIIFKRVTNQ
jgi:hypothetical protein